jgi:hypothetical protein
MHVIDARGTRAGLRSLAARRVLCAGLSLSMVTSLSACYAYIPTREVTLAEQTPVTVRLTLGGTVALQSTLGGGVTELDGTVQRSTADSLILSVEKMYTSGRQEFGSTGTTAALPRGYVDQVLVRTFSRKRTGLTLLGGLALAIAAGSAVNAGGGSAPGPGPGPVQP